MTVTVHETPALFTNKKIAGNLRLSLIETLYRNYSSGILWICMHRDREMESPTAAFHSFLPLAFAFAFDRIKNQLKIGRIDENKGEIK